MHNPSPNPNRSNFHPEAPLLLHTSPSNCLPSMSMVHATCEHWLYLVVCRCLRVCISCPGVAYTEQARAGSACRVGVMHPICSDGKPGDSGAGPSWALPTSLCSFIISVSKGTAGVELKTSLPVCQLTDVLPGESSSEIDWPLYPSTSFVLLLSSVQLWWDTYILQPLCSIRDPLCR